MTRITLIKNNYAIFALVLLGTIAILQRQITESLKPTFIIDSEPRLQSPRQEIISYVVEKEDTLPSIASQFDISIETIKWANNLTSDTVFSGQRLEILPVSGVMHVVSEGDNIESLALKYHTSPQNIIDYPFNEFADLETHTLTEGVIIIIPDGVKTFTD